MDLATLQKIITHAGGESKILGLIFDNSTRKLFFNGFKLSDYLMPDSEIMHFSEKDMFGNPYHVYKCIECLQAVITAEANTDLVTLDTRLIGS
jgi:hypothetical protein